MAVEKLVTLLNRGQRTLQVKDHSSKEEKTILFAPNSTIEVPEAVAKELLDYHDIVDASKIVKASPSKVDDALLKENADLKAQIVKLEAELEKLKKKDK